MQVYQVSNLTIQSAVAMLGIDYDDDDKAYGWDLTSLEIEQGKDADLSSWARKSNWSLCVYLLLLIGFET